MKFSHENLEIWQLGMKLVEVTYSLKNHFLNEDKFGLWDQIVRASEAIPRDIAEGYGKSSNKERALYMERAKSETAEVDTSYKLAIKKGRITTEEYEKMIKPIIQELYFKIIGYRKWILKSNSPSAAINQIPQAQRSTKGFTLISKACEGFTLIEILVVVFLFGIIMTISGALFSSVLRGSGKSEITKEVKQSGDYAMGMMERSIRNAKTVSGCSLVSSSSISMTDRDGFPTTFGCVFDNSLDVSSISLNSGALVNKLTGNNVTLGIGGTGGCPGDLSFTCNNAVNPPQVTISFTLYQKGTSSKPEDQAKVKFQSTVSLRTY